MHVNITRLILAALYLLATVILFNLNLSLSFSQYLYLAVSGFIGLVFGDTFLFRSFQQIGARLSMLIMSSAPAISAILAYFVLGELLSPWGILGIAITISGITLVVLERPDTSSSKYKITPLGLWYGFLGAVGQGTGLIFARMAFNVGEINGFVATFIRILSSVIVLVPLVLFTDRYKDPVGVFKADPRAFGLTVTGSILGPFFGITFSLIAVAHAKVGIAATIMATVPILMLPLVHFLYKESLSWKSITGAFLAVAGVGLLFLA
jgi:drug/metabolite transporter (DMT)-like permease